MDATTATAAAKRKRTATDIPGDSGAAATVDEVSDSEVEEFYAILRRMRDASRRLCGAGARPPPRAPAWRPSFSWEDFAPANPAPAQPRPDGRPPESAAPPRAGLDLNAEPEPDSPSAPAPRTPQSARAKA